MDSNKVFSLLSLEELFIKIKILLLIIMIVEQIQVT